MRSEAHENNKLERVWNDLQHTPSYVERFQANPGSLEADTSRQTWNFCSQCGFWVEDTHQCPQEVCA